MYKFIALCCSLVFVIGLSACSKDKTQEQAGTKPPAQEQASTPQPAQQAPPGPGLTAGPAPVPVTGKVLETMDSGGYTYFKVATDSGEKWVAINETPVKAGDEVTYMDGMVMHDFVSKTLDRTFPEIVFSGGLVGKDGAAIPGAATGGATGGASGESFSQALNSEGSTAAATDMVTGSQKAVVPPADIKVEKAPGDNSYTVAEIFSKAAELNGKKVVVRGKVVKVSPRIMGRNWIHIQDGTGSQAENNHDLVITTSQDPGADWDVITMEGVLAANKDFGSGYTYAVIIEEAQRKD